MKYRVSHTTRYAYQGTVPIGYNRVYLTPRSTPCQACVRSQLDVAPVPAVFGYRGQDYFGNEVTFFTVQEQHSLLEVTARSEVHLTPGLPPEIDRTPPWEAVRSALRAAKDRDSRAASPFTFSQESPAVAAALRAYAAASFAEGTPVLAGAVDLMGRIYREFTYDPAATTIATPVEDILEKRRGVCQDFAHLQIGCLRALGLAARYISGYVAPKQSGSGQAYVGAQASHAWLSLFAPGLGWVDLDPTNNVLPSTEHITVAWGRCYDDVSPMRGVILGGGSQRLEVDVDVSPLPVDT